MIMMISWILLYITIGTLLAYILNKNETNTTKYEELVKMGLVCVALWPVMIFVYVISGGGRK